VTACGRNLEWLHSLTLGSYVNLLARLNSERWSVNQFAIYKNVAVYNELSSLRHSSSESTAEYKGIETHFQEFHKVFTS
jgi:hypothetical protein